MAGIGVRLNRIYNKNTITTNVFGFGYSTVITVAPMFLVILAVMLMQYLLGFSKLGYASRELYASTVLYIFIFALLSASPFNAVLSKYMSDVIYWETYEDIMPCFHIGLVMNVIISSILGIPFVIREYFVGQVALPFVLAGYLGYMTLVLVFYTMLYLSICKDYKKISYYFLWGMGLTVILSLILVKLFKVECTFAMLVSLDAGFMLIAILEFAKVRSYFRTNSGKYKEVLLYFKKYWQLVITNFLYTLGLYIHNFVFWTTDMRIVVVKCFVSMMSYDMATCLAMFTNISATVIFISRVEMYFHERYKLYSEAVIGGRKMDIEESKHRMFSQLSEELLNLVRIQFIVSVVVFLLAVIFLPRFGYGGLVMQIYPCLAAGYFILFVMYAEIIFLYYYNDFDGALITALVFCAATVIGAWFSTFLSPIWYGTGLVIGSTIGFITAYFRIRHIERTLDIHIFCKGSLMKKGEGKKPSNLVYTNPAYAKKKGGEK
ncbi:MAG: exopolysaccharide Pel transporter PelG [Lachnospiraceae bacterium]|nr:exopolysaccharide Pel transporter PelG [Lachnospiraceae bacterium]